MFDPLEVDDARNVFHKNAGNCRAFHFTLHILPQARRMVLDKSDFRSESEKQVA